MDFYLISNSAVFYFSFSRRKKVMSYPAEYRTCWGTTKKWRSCLVLSPTLIALMLLKIGWESQDILYFLRRGAAFHPTPSTLVFTTSPLTLLPLDHFLLVTLATIQRWHSQERNQRQVSMLKAVAQWTASTWPKITVVRRRLVLVSTKKVTAELMENVVLRCQA